MRPRSLKSQPNKAVYTWGETCMILPVKAALAVGKNHNVLLMMMRAFPPSVATASDANTTSGFGSGLGSGGQSKNRRSYLKLMLCCFLLNSCPHAKFHPNWTKNIEVKMICYWLASVG